MGRLMFRVLYAVLLVLMLPVWPLFWLHCRLSARPCPKCGSEWRTDLVGEWDCEMWACRRCGHDWEFRP